ncbi:MAG: hypothetical protein FJZ58_02220 [Chlamydiae bacterium]|nr:hypothetical protein [Chlamydiota bacterium]
MEEKKKLERILELIRPRISPQTGFLHANLEDLRDPRQDPIPLTENLLYASVLLHTKSVQHIQEGRVLLEKILAFESEGNFPLYLHEYPSCRSAYQAVELLPIFFYLLRNCTSILSDDLQNRLISLSKRILQNLQKEELPKIIQRKIDAFLGRFSQEDWYPTSPAEWAEYCLCSQMQGSSLQPALDQWNRNLCVYMGEAFQYLQEGEEPLVTLFDYFMGEALGNLSARAEQNPMLLLRSILVRPMTVDFQASKGTTQEAFLLMPGQRPSGVLYFGGREKTHSFALDAKKGEWRLDKSKERIYVLSYTYAEEIPREEESVECAFFLNLSAASKVLIQGKQATLFRPGEWVEMVTESGSLRFCFIVDRGEGQWTGHILRGNRPLQKDKSPFACYDRIIALRTLRRSSIAKLQIIVETV